MKLQDGVLYRQVRFEEAKSEALHALEIYEKFGAANNAGLCRELLQEIKRKLLGTIPHPTPANFPL
jgi:hypothetical protein